MLAFSTSFFFVDIGRQGTGGCGGWWYRLTGGTDWLTGGTDWLVVQTVSLGTETWLFPSFGYAAWGLWRTLEFWSFFSSWFSLFFFFFIHSCIIQCDTLTHACMAKRLHQNKLTYMTLLCEYHFIIHTCISKPRMKPTDVLKFCQSHINKVEKQQKNQIYFFSTF